MNNVYQLQFTASDRLAENMANIPAIIRHHLLTNESVLKPKQKEAVSAAISKIDGNGHQAVAMVMPTATGKMVIVARMLAAICNNTTTKRRSLKILFVCDGIEGIKQARKKMSHFAGIEAGAYYGRAKDCTKQVTVTTY